MSKKIPGVPDQREGGYHDTESEKCFSTIEEAAGKYQVLRQRLLDFNAWHTYGGSASATFIHCDSNGVEIHRAPKIGDYVKIDIPGPGSLAGEGYDWVQITQIDEHPYEEDQRCFIQCVPSTNPTDPENTDIAHFYSSDATSNFIVRRKGNCITAEIHGRNEVSNIATNSLPDKARNTVVSLGGVAGIAKIQWKSLAEGLLNF